MKILSVLLFIPVAALAQLDPRLTVRVQVELIAANRAAALTFSNAVEVAIPTLERQDPENKADPLRVREDGDGRIRILSTYILRDYSTATNIVRQLTAIPNAALTGRIHVHCCPKEGAIKDWGGCDADARAKAREIRL